MEFPAIIVDTEQLNNALNYLTQKQNNGLKEMQLQENLWMLNKMVHHLKVSEKRSDMGNIRNPNIYTDPLLNEGDEFIIGFGIKSLTTTGTMYDDLSKLIRGEIDELLVRGRKPILRENTQGKFKRTDPPIKVEELKHISYYTKKGNYISYDRIFEIWKKELVHKFNLKLHRSVSPQGEVIIHFEKLRYHSNNDQQMLMVKAQMNIAQALGGVFSIYDTDLELIVPVSETLDRDMFIKAEGIIKEKIEIIREYLANQNNKDSEANSYRFSVLNEFNITDVKNAKGGFNDYFIFFFADDNIVIMEHLRDKNATFIFDLSKFDIDEIIDKRSAPNNPAFIARIIHHNLESWREDLQKYLSTKRDDLDPLPIAI